jgi:hypothetical protein
MGPLDAPERYALIAVAVKAAEAKAMLSRGAVLGLLGGGE